MTHVPLRVLFDKSNGDRKVKNNLFCRRECKNCCRSFIGGSWHRRCGLCPTKPRVGGWPTERGEQLETLVEEGHSFGEIARRMGLTRNAVIGRAHRQGLTREPPLRPIVSWSYPPAGCCHWPHGDPGSPGFHFCGAKPVLLGRPYCAKHDRRARSRVPGE
jgi:GcrA cell cycle regulator